MINYDNEYRKKVADAQKKIDELYNQMYTLVALWAIQSNIDIEKRFWFSQYLQLDGKVQNLIESTSNQVEKTIRSTTKDAWRLSNTKNDALVDNFYQNINRKPPTGLKQQNLDSLETFINRKVGGLNLSQRVWKYNPSVKAQMQASIDIAINKGKSAQSLARDLKKYLNEPDKLFRRVRDKYGQLKWSKKAMMYNPGQGVYRSAHQNALRLARNEINTAYREADYERWRKLDFITGYRIQNSTRISTVCPICKQFNGVVFPKSFKFTGFHIQCLCVAIPVTADEMPVVNMPKEFTEFLEHSKGKINEDTQPKWYADNKALIDPKGDILKYRIRPDMLRRRGFEIIADNVLNYNKILKGFNLERFDTELSNIAKNKGIDISKRQLTIEDDKVNLFYRGKGGFFLDRTFENGLVRHNLLEIPQNLQGEGISKQIFQSLYKQYKNADINKIELTANITVGGYAWAKYGFSAKAESYNELRSWANWQLSEKVITTDNYSDFNKWIDTFKGQNIPLYELTKKPYAKRLLLDSNWNGVIDLSDKKVLSIFEEYINS